MMADLHKELIEILEDNDFQIVTIDDKEIICRCVIENHAIELRCVLPSTFPYELPLIYIDKKCYEEIKPIPHIDKDYQICTFNKSYAIPNFNYPKNIILDSLLQAKKIISEGILKKNFQDFLEEFHAYWTIGCQGVAQSIVTVTDHPKKIKCYNHKEIIYIADNEAELNRLLELSGVKKKYSASYKDGIYLPISSGFYPPFPNSNYEMYCTIKNSCQEFYRQYADFLKSNLSVNKFVLFSFPYNGRRHIELFSHSAVSSNINGFRKGHVPVEIAYIIGGKKSPVWRYSVTDLSQERLFYRGGTGLVSKINKIAIIGCGSVGGYIAEAMSEYGISNYVLVDNDILSSENIARHYCGYKYIGFEKVMALKTILCEHNPNVCVESYYENAFGFIDDKISVLTKCDIIFVSTALFPLEYKIVDLVNRFIINNTVVLIWVEPYLAGGHALILHKPQDVFRELFDEQFLFKERIVINGEGFLLKEAGCQSAFVPYSAFSLKQFIYTFLDYLMNENIMKNKLGNYHCTWCGNLSFAIKQGCQIPSRWMNAENYSLHIERID